MRMLKLTRCYLLNFLRGAVWLLGGMLLYCGLYVLGFSGKMKLLYILGAVCSMGCLFLSATLIAGNLRSAASLVEQTSDMPVWQQMLAKTITLVLMNTLSCIMVGLFVATAYGARLWEGWDFMFFWEAVVLLICMGMLVGLGHIITGCVRALRRLRTVVTAAIAFSLTYLVGQAAGWIGSIFYAQPGGLSGVFVDSAPLAITIVQAGVFLIATALAFFASVWLLNTRYDAV